MGPRKPRAFLRTERIRVVYRLTFKFPFLVSKTASIEHLFLETRERRAEEAQ